MCLFVKSNYINRRAVCISSTWHGVSFFIAMKYVVCAIALALVMASCKKGETRPTDVAGITAQKYYEYLMKADYKSFAQGTYHAHELPAGYESQLVINAQMYKEHIDSLHKGIAGVQVVKSVADTTRHTANVFLKLKFADSTTQQILVPMVYHKQVWYMR